MHSFHVLREKICCDLDDIAKKDNFSMADIEILEKLSTAAKNLDKLIMRDESGAEKHTYKDDLAAKLEKLMEESSDHDEKEMLKHFRSQI